MISCLNKAEMKKKKRITWANNKFSLCLRRQKNSDRRRPQRQGEKSTWKRERVLGKIREDSMKPMAR